MKVYTDPQHYQDIAAAIRAKLGTLARYKPEDMPSAIRSIETEPSIETITITVNGEYSAPSGVDGYSPIIVNVSGGGGETPPEGAFAIIIATFPEGYLCTCSDGTTSVSARNTDGLYGFIVYSAGTYTIAITNGSVSNSKTVNIISRGQSTFVHVSAGLPSEYQRVEYLQSTGSQYIDTGVSGSTPTGFEIDFQLVSTSGSFFGYRTGSTSGRFGCMNWSSRFHMMMSSGDIWNYSIDTNRHTGSVQVSSDYSYTWTFDSYSGSGTTNSNVCANTTFKLFYDSYDSKGSLKIYSCNLYDSSGECIRELVACYRISDNTAGFYDLVNDVFYTNAGSGTFTLGPDVN